MICDAVEIHVEDRQVRLPLGERGWRPRWRSQPSRVRVDAMVERQLDELDEHRSIEHHEHPGWAARRPMSRLRPDGVHDGHGHPNVNHECMSFPSLVNR